VVLAESQGVSRVALNHFLEDKRLHQVGHMTAHKECLHLLKLGSVLHIQPKASLRVPRSLALGFFLDFSQDTRRPFHLVVPLLRFLQEALVDEESLSEVLHISTLVTQKVSVEASNVFIVDFLLHYLLDFFVGLLVAGSDSFGDLTCFVVVNLAL